MTLLELNSLSLDGADFKNFYNQYFNLTEDEKIEIILNYIKENPVYVNNENIKAVYGNLYRFLYSNIYLNKLPNHYFLKKINITKANPYILSLENIEDKIEKYQITVDADNSKFNNPVFNDIISYLNSYNNSFYKIPGYKSSFTENQYNSIINFSLNYNDSIKNKLYLNDMNSFLNKFLKNVSKLIDEEIENKKQQTYENMINWKIYDAYKEISDISYIESIDNINQMIFKYILEKFFNEINNRTLSDKLNKLYADCNTFNSKFKNKRVNKGVNND